jgi:hypothetical protein
LGKRVILSATTALPKACLLASPFAIDPPGDWTNGDEVVFQFEPRRAFVLVM